MKAVVVAVLLLIAAPLLRAHDDMADRVIVNKSERILMLMQGDNVLRSYNISLGLAPRGHKVQEGDFRTPEGDYLLTRRRVDSDYFMAIEVSYPNSRDAERARALGVDPGGSIMIHGLPTEPRKPASYYQRFDWTDGCIAVSNEAMVEIWQLTGMNTPITIIP